MAHLKHISEAGNWNYGMSEYAAYFSYTITSGPWTAAPALIKVIELEKG